MKHFFLIILFIAISNVLFCQENSSECDTTVFLLVNEMPMYFGNLDGALKNVYKQLDKELKNMLRNSTTELEWSIDCKGHVEIDCKDFRFKSFSKIVAEELNKLIWIPGTTRGKKVNVVRITPVLLNDNILRLPMQYKQAKGKLKKCKITDEKTGLPITDVRLTTKYNNHGYASNQQGEVMFYCDDNDEIEINHLNYKTFDFRMPKDVSSFSIKLSDIEYELEPIDLIKYNPDKLPYERNNCEFTDWQEIEKSFVVMGMQDYYAPETADFNGGFECFRNYVVKEFQLPQKALENGYSENLDIYFTVNVDGKISKVKFSKQLNFEVDSVINDIFIKMPKWKPGYQNKLKTEQNFVVKLNFGVNKYWEKYYGLKK